MGLIYQKNILPLRPIRKIAFQPDIRIKHIIIVTDYSIHKAADIQAVFKGTDLKFFRIFKNDFPRNPKLLMDNLIHRIIYPVKVAFGIRTGIGIALRFFQKAEFIFSCDGNGAEIKPLLPQNRKCLLRHASRNCLSRQIKKFISMPLSDCLQAGKYGG